jgi:hypothetical protein
MHGHNEALCWFSTVRSIASWPSLLESIVAHSRWVHATELHGTAGSCLSLAAGLHTGTVVMPCMQSAKADTVAQVCMVAAHVVLPIETSRPLAFLESQRTTLRK